MNNKLNFFRDPYIIGALLILLITRTIFFVQSGSHLQINGDEYFYFGRAKILLTIFWQTFTLDWGSIPANWNLVVDRGWFLPGMSIILMPVRVFTDSVEIARLYILIINLGLGILMLRQAFLLFGKGQARLLIFFMILAPAYGIFSFTFFGETIAGHLAVLLLLHIYGYLSSAANNFRFTIKHMCQAALLLSLIIYIRPNFILLAPVAVLCYFLMFFYTDKFWKATGKTAMGGTLMAIVVIIFLLPWSLSVSKKYGGLFLLTTSYSIQKAYIYGSPDLKQQMKEAANTQNLSVAVHTYYLNKSIKEGKSFAAAVKEDRRKFNSEITVKRYFLQVKHNIRGYFFSENAFLLRFKNITQILPEKRAQLSNYYDFLMSLNTMFWYGLLFITLLVFIVLINPAKQFSWILFAKLFLIAIGIQPFHAVVHGRYYPGLIPIMLLVTSFVINIGLKNILSLRVGANSSPALLNLILQIVLSSLISGFFLMSYLYTIYG